RLGLDTCLQPAIDVAERGFAIGRHTARYWSEAQARAPVAGELRTDPDQATTLRAIAQSGPTAIYEGPIAAKIAGASWLSESDLAAYAPAWVQPMHKSYGSLDVHELPPPSQGVAALEALAILEQLGVDTLPDQVQAVSLALEDAYAEVRDGRDVAHLLEPEYVRARAAATAAPAGELGGGTVYLCAVDEERMAVSFIQSLYQSFGSGVLVPGTGIYLNNRAACFAVHGRVEPGRRPFHTLMPGLLTDPDGSLIGPFGVMGGFIQAQAHAQFVIAAQRADLDPQAALDHPRFRVDGRAVQLEPPLWDEAQKLEGRGFKAIRSRDVSLFGGGQAVFVRGGALLGGSDARKDGCAAGI
ncbi:MAG TPA: gamma-glutamyltransferase, partial [Solirubrobacteraceae bacterium]|nr:gamma-glutamyltransferase [Solirubrobacteraceae bacterium]